MENLWLIRHSERLKDLEEAKWKLSKRYIENKYDDPITNNGKKIAKLCANNLVKNDPNIDQFEFIYSSPMTRCIQTSILISKTIFKLINKLIKIRIEYNLAPNLNVPYNDLELKNNKIVVVPKILLDDKLQIKNIIKKYTDKGYGQYFDTDYNSISIFDETKFFNYDVLNYYNKKINILDQIKSNHKNIIICTHADIFYPFIFGLTKEDPNKIINKDKIRTYCISLLFNNVDNVYQLKNTISNDTFVN